MFLLVTALAAAPPPEPAISPRFVPPPHSTANCARTESYVTGAGGRYDGKPLTPRKLSDLPPANMYVAVDRFDENGCLVPIVVKYNLGH